MRPPYCRTSASSPAGCASVTNASACIPFRYGRPARQTFHGHALREDVHGPQRLPPLLCRTRRTAAVMQPHLFAICVHRRRTGNPADDGENSRNMLSLSNTAGAMPLTRSGRRCILMRHITRSASRQMPLQRHRLGGGCGRVPPHQERHGQPAGHDGMHAKV